MNADGMEEWGGELPWDTEFGGFVFYLVSWAIAVSPVMPLQDTLPAHLAVREGLGSPSPSAKTVQFLLRRLCPPSLGPGNPASFWATDTVCKVRLATGNFTAGWGFLVVGIQHSPKPTESHPTSAQPRGSFPTGSCLAGVGEDLEPSSGNSAYTPHPSKMILGYSW